MSNNAIKIHASAFILTYIGIRGMMVYKRIVITDQTMLVMLSVEDDALEI